MTLEQANPQDREHLRLLAVFHYVVGGLAALFASIFLVHVFMGGLMTFRPEALGSGEPAPGFIGVLFMVFGSAALILGWAFAGTLIYAGRCLLATRRYTFCLVVAAVACAFAPFGTVLGVFTILVLLRPSVKQLFGIDPQAPIPG
jgi:hypothetical protein